MLDCLQDEIKIPLNRIQGKCMSENKSVQITIECLSSYVGDLCDKRIILYLIVERDSNEKQANEIS